jgi:hypothetical protein
VFPCQEREGPVVAGHADPQRAAADDLIEAGRLLRLRGGDGKKQRGKASQDTKHRVLSAMKNSSPV